MIASVVLLLGVVLLLSLLFQNHRTKDFPPGPRPLPILGNLLQLNLENPIADLERLAKRYGNVYSIFIGKRPAVVINGLQALKEALVTKAADFSGRSQDLMVNHVVLVKANAQGVILADYNTAWKEQRRFWSDDPEKLWYGEADDGAEHSESDRSYHTADRAECWYVQLST
ncbi:hypothetical protein CgunFtcFv8_013510 [Champsocephalus gunnari]|uniref:Uncharacterized protein n=1 Tax=Champsocephalus gunnari TaxID=52237 RepID=A0AAN8HUV6_CHAGU|nr:hypothetical protein CgunFtcFv8_013510 [Champsocephalus gunnari]